MPRERCEDLPFRQQLECMSKVDLYHIMKDCSAYDEEEVTMTVAALSKKYEEQGISERERKILTLFACSTDQKQYTLGLDMHTIFLYQDAKHDEASREEFEKHMLAIYLLAGVKDGEEKCMPRIKAGFFLARLHDGKDLSDIVDEATTRHLDFILQMKAMRKQKEIPFENIVYIEEVRMRRAAA